MTKIEATNILKEFIDTYIKSHREEDVITVQLDNVDVEAFSTIIKELEKETVSRESYDHEYFLRKEHEVEIEKLRRSIRALKKIRKLEKDSILDILDKIRAEIVDLGQRTMNDNRASGIWACRDTIDKYKESADKK